MNMQGKIERDVTETRTYERTTEDEFPLNVLKGQTQAIFLTVRVRETIVTVSGQSVESVRSSRGPRVDITVERRRKDGERSYTGNRQISLEDLSDRPDRYSRSTAGRTFDAETIGRLRVLRQAVLDEYMSIDWTER